MWRVLSWGKRERVCLATLVLFASGCVYGRAALGVYEGEFVYMSRVWYVSVVCVELGFCESCMFGVFVVCGWGLCKEDNQYLLCVCMGSGMRVVVCMLDL